MGLIFGMLIIFILMLYIVIPKRVNRDKQLKRFAEKVTGYKLNGELKLMRDGSVKFKGKAIGKMWNAKRLMIISFYIRKRTRYYIDQVPGVQIKPLPSQLAIQNVKKDWKRVTGVVATTICLIVIFHIFSMPLIASSFPLVGIARTWGGGSAMTGNWGTNTCWTGDTVPGAGDTVTFDGTNTTACSVNVQVAALASTTITSAYTNTITLAINQVNTMGTYTQAVNSTFNSAGYDWIAGAVSFNGGTMSCGASNVTWTSFTSSSGTRTATFTSANLSIGGSYTALGAGVGASWIWVSITLTAGGTFIGLPGPLRIAELITINAGVTYTPGNPAGTFGNLTLNGTIGPGGVGITFAKSPLVITLGGAYSITNTAEWKFYGVNGLTMPAITMSMYMTTNLAANIAFTNSVTCQYILIDNGFAAAVDFGGQNITTTHATNGIGISAGASTAHITCGAATIITNGVSIASAGAYMVMNTSNWSVSGNWTSASTSALYNAGTSTVTFTANGNLNTVGGGGGGTALNQFYSVVINTGKIVTLTSHYTLCNNITFNGTATLTGNFYFSLNGAPNCITLSGTQTISCLALNFVQTANVNIPAGTYSGLYIQFPITGLTVFQQGNIITTGSFGVSTYYCRAPGTSTWDTGGFNLTINNNGGLTIGNNTTNTGVLLCYGSTINLNGGSSFTIQNATSYIVFATSTWNVTGAWSNISTSASWSAGTTATINFNGSANVTLGLNNGNSANIKYMNITISTTGAVTVTIGPYGITILGLLNVTTTTATVLWDSSAATSILTVSGGITLANGSGWIHGYSLVLAASQTITDNNTTPKNLGRVTINAGAYTINYAQRLAVGTLVNNGTWANAPTYPLSQPPTAFWDSLTIGAGAVLITLPFLHSNVTTPITISPAANATNKDAITITAVITGGAVPDRVYAVITDGTFYKVKMMSLLSGTTYQCVFPPGWAWNKTYTTAQLFVESTSTYGTSIGTLGTTYTISEADGTTGADIPWDGHLINQQTQSQISTIQNCIVPLIIIAFGLLIGHFWHILPFIGIGTAFTWAGGTGVWNAGGNWTGGTGANYPGQAAGDTATFTNATAVACSANYALANPLTSLTITNYAGTITCNIGQTLSFGTFATSSGTINTNGFTCIFGTMTFNAGSTVQFGASSITAISIARTGIQTYQPGSAQISVAGNYTMSFYAGITVGTEVVTITTNATVTGNNTYDVTAKCNSLVISTGITVISTGFVTNTCTINGTGKLQGLLGIIGTGTPLTLSGSEQYAANAGFSFNSVTCNLTASIRYDTIYIENASVVTLLGTTTAKTFTVAPYQGGAVGTPTAQLITGGNALNCTTLNVGTGIANRHGFITATTSVITVTTVNIATVDVASYLLMGSSQWSVSGNWTNSSTSVNNNVGTSTVTFTATANIALASLGYTTGDFYNLIINPTFTLTLTTAQMGIVGTLTTNGSLGGLNTRILVLLGSGNCWIRGGADTISLSADFRGNATIPGGTYGGAIVITANTGTLGGNIIVNGTFDGTIAFYTQNSGKFNTSVNNYSVTTPSTKQFYLGGPTSFMTCNASVFTIGIFYAPNAASYMLFNTSTWYVAGGWTCASTSANWNPGTSTINFNGSTSVSLLLNNGNSANISYYNITISTTGANTLTMGPYNIKILGLLNVSTTTATVLWDSSAATSILTVSGGITLANGSGWIHGYSLVLAASQTITDNNTTPKNLGRVTINAGAYTINYAQRLAVGTLVNNGTWANAPTYPLSQPPTAFWDSLTIGAGAVLITLPYASAPVISGVITISPASPTTNKSAITVTAVVTGSPDRVYMVITDFVYYKVKMMYLVSGNTYQVVLPPGWMWPITYPSSVPRKLFVEATNAYGRTIADLHADYVVNSGDGTDAPDIQYDGFQIKNQLQSQVVTIRN